MCEGVEHFDVPAFLSRAAPTASTLPSGALLFLDLSACPLLSCCFRCMLDPSGRSAAVAIEWAVLMNVPLDGPGTSPERSAVARRHATSVEDTSERGYPRGKSRFPDRARSVGPASRRGAIGPSSPLQRVVMAAHGYCGGDTATKCARSRTFRIPAPVFHILNRSAPVMKKMPRRAEP